LKEKGKLTNVTQKGGQGADFELMKRWSRPRGLAWGPHARKLDHAETECEKQ